MTIIVPHLDVGRARRGIDTTGNVALDVPVKKRVVIDAYSLFCHGESWRI